MRILCCNVNGRVKAARDRQVKAVLRRKPDVIALQEVTGNSYPGWCDGLTRAGYSLVSTIDLAALPYPGPSGGRYPSPPFPPNSGKHIKRRFFNLTASRHPIAPLPGLSFEDPEKALYAFPEKYLAVRIRLGRRNVDVHNAHVPPGVSRGVLKIHAFEAIRRRLDQRTRNPQILCGDFNAPLSEDEDGPVIERGGNWPAEIQDSWIDAERSVLAHKRLRDTYRAAHKSVRRFPASHFTGETARRYDYIFVSSSFRVERCQYLTRWLDRDKDRRRLSDHSPVEADLALSGRPASS